MARDVPFLPSGPVRSSHDPWLQQTIQSCGREALIFSVCADYWDLDDQERIMRAAMIMMINLLIIRNTAAIDMNGGRGLAG